MFDLKNWIAKAFDWDEKISSGNDFDNFLLPPLNTRGSRNMLLRKGYSYAKFCEANVVPIAGQSHGNGRD
jgi:hypothetical protein